jgi:hypothetical protein
VRCRSRRHGSTTAVSTLDRPAAARLEAYKFFFPTVSGPAIFKGTATAGPTTNQVYGTMDTRT